MSSSLDLQLDRTKDQNVLDFLTYSKLPSIRRLRIGRIELLLYIVGKFLDKFPDSLNSFTLNWRYSASNRAKIDSLVPKLSKCLANVKYEFFAAGLEVNYDSLSSIIRSCRHVKRVIIFGSKIINSGKMDLGNDTDFDTQYLSF